MDTAHPRKQDFLAQVAAFDVVQRLFDSSPDIVFSIKDRDGRYRLMSKAALRRCGLRHAHDAVGKTAFDLFPRHMAERYTEQDRRVFASGRPIADNLDLTVYGDGSSGWCLSSKEPLFDRQGRIVGLACLSRDIGEPARGSSLNSGFAQAVDALLDRFDERIALDTLADQAGMSMAQFDRRMKRVFQLSASQFLTRRRIDHAAHLLAGSDTAIAEIALRCGYADQSALSRQFRRTTGLTPGQYRALHRDDPSATGSGG